MTLCLAKAETRPPFDYTDNTTGFYGRETQINPKNSAKKFFQGVDFGIVKCYNGKQVLFLTKGERRYEL